MNEELLLKYITGQATEGEKITILNYNTPVKSATVNKTGESWVMALPLH